jgi:hypothetical protein
MPIIAVRKETNLWEDICAEFALKRAQAEAAAIPTRFLHVKTNGTNHVDVKPNNDKQVFDASKHTPVFCNYIFRHTPIDDTTQIRFDTRISHPACINYALTSIDNNVDKQTILTTTNHSCSSMTNSCKDLPAVKYLEQCVYPVLLNGIEQLLKEAEKRKCFEHKRNAFNALDYLTRYLYFRNPCRIDAITTSSEPSLSDSQQALEDIPFVRQHFEKYPRAPLPKSLLWSDDEAAVIIQAFYRGYRVRKNPEVQELRQWQQEWRESNRNIHDVVDEFWRQHASPLPI